MIDGYNKYMHFILYNRTDITFNIVEEGFVVHQ